MSTYHVSFEPSIQGAPSPQVAISNPITNETRTLPTLLPSGSYTLVWVLIGNPGAIAPGLVAATDTAAANPVPKIPIGFDAAGKPISVVNTAAHDVIHNYRLP